MFDFSVFKNIDFKNSDNLLFLSIILFLAAFVFLVFFVIVAKIIKIIKKFIVKNFNIDVKEPKLKQKEHADWLKGKLESSEQNAGAPKRKITGSDFNANFISGEKNDAGPEKNSQQKFDEKEQKDIIEGLSKLKLDSSDSEETLDSKMPQRTENQEADKHKKIEIPKAKRFFSAGVKQDTGAKQVAKNIPVTEESGNQEAEKQEVVGFEKTAVTTNRGVIMPEKNITGPVVVTPAHASEEHNLKEPLKPENLPVLEEPDFVQDKLGVHSAHKIKNEDQSIFEGKPEVSKIKLEYEMKKDPKVWKASKQVGLNLSPVQRAKLVKEVFSSALGRNVSKSDLKWSIKKLNQKMLDAKDPNEHAKIRKEIKFFKKIGGIK